MGKIPEIIPVTDFRKSSAEVLQRVRQSQEPVFITQRGRAAAVMLSVEAYERSEQERDLLLQLARGDREIAEGEGYDLDDVLAEADRLLATDDR